MTIQELSIPGVLLITSEIAADDRGSFRRVADLDQLSSAGATSTVSQVSVAANHLAGTVRGMHYQVAPSEEAKTLWCLSGRVFDVVVDLRADSRPGANGVRSCFPRRARPPYTSRPGSPTATRP